MFQQLYFRDEILNNNEGITDGVYLVGDMMYDAAIQNMEIADNRSNILDLLLTVKNIYYLPYTDPLILIIKRI